MGLLVELSPGSDPFATPLLRTLVFPAGEDVAFLARTAPNVLYSDFSDPMGLLKFELYVDMSLTKTPEQAEKDIQCSPVNEAAQILTYETRTGTRAFGTGPKKRCLRGKAFVRGGDDNLDLDADKLQGVLLFIRQQLEALEGCGMGEWRNVMDEEFELYKEKLWQPDENELGSKIYGAEDLKSTVFETVETANNSKEDSSKKNL